MKEQFLYQILSEYKKFPQVKAIALGDSSSAKTSDSSSDIDVYVFTTENIPIEARESYTPAKKDL